MRLVPITLHLLYCIQDIPDVAAEVSIIAVTQKQEVPCVCC